eukprot:CAMPEP_0168502040 /NCGR_PEP_ID=MMETSP0228-20121227/75114_1 /TAXON_ID=133427 /ORGANISM="Protoceratium reticulatum, Strain CCCM 535 (=CCMP 1889)" /LENGTH=55 /DNA_ID=CAMNT_0008519011 /DNA_START=138 /DNA_END=302 /DNA_ORIENTATION=-
MRSGQAAFRRHTARLHWRSQAQAWRSGPPVRRWPAIADVHVGLMGLSAAPDHARG